MAFPGLHSVLWEQAVGMGKPCVFRKIEGFTHVDVGGNCVYFQEETPEGYVKTLRHAIEKREEMKQCAQAKGLETFSYSKIASRSIMGGNGSW